MPEAGDFPTRDTIAGQHGRQHQIHDIGFGGAEAAWSGDDRDIVFVAQQEEIARLHGRQETLDVTSGPNHGAADHIVRTRRGGGGSDQHNGWLGAQQMLERTGDSAFLFHRRKDKTGAGSDAIQTLAHDIFEQLPGPFAIDGSV